MNAEDAKQALKRLADPERAKQSARYFKSGAGQYGEGDQFIGVKVPEQRKVAAEFSALPQTEILTLLCSPIHEHRLTALFILVRQYAHADKVAKKQIASFYHKNRQYINNWDLVDSSAPYILGDYLVEHSPGVLFRLASSRSMWDRRIAIIATFAWIRQGNVDCTLKIAENLLADKEDLIHKATGWALREVGKKDIRALRVFLDGHAATMPRTTLRYAIERLSPEERKHYLNVARRTLDA